MFIIAKYYKNKYLSIIKPKLDVIELWRQQGDTIENIINKLGVSRPTFYKYVEEYPELKNIIEKSKEILAAQLTKSLYREATGYTVEEYTEEYIVDENGNKSASKKVKKTIKFMRPSTSALIFAIKNLMPDRFQQADKNIIITNSDNQNISFTDKTIQKAYNVLYGINEDNKTEVESQIKELENFGNDEE